MLVSLSQDVLSPQHVILLSGSVITIFIISIIFGSSITVFILFFIFDVLHHLLTDGSKHLGHVTDIMVSIHHHHWSRHRLVMMYQPVLVKIMQVSHIVLTDQVLLTSTSLLDPLQGNFWRCLETLLIRHWTITRTQVSFTFKYTMRSTDRLI